jgi:hypothetical protein
MTPARVTITLPILAIDPGCDESAYVIYRDGKVLDHGKVQNGDALYVIRSSGAVDVVIERIASYGMAVGAEVFETCVWSGRFMQAAISGGLPVTRLYRRDVKLYLCQSPRAKDANVRQALIDRYGGKAAAIGTKKSPGPLYGVKADVWAALAVAVCHADGVRSK